METLISNTFDFIFNWTTYFWMIPVWTILLFIFLKHDGERVSVIDLVQIIIVGCLNPIVNLLIIILIPSFIVLFVLIKFRNLILSIRLN